MTKEKRKRIKLTPYNMEVKNTKQGMVMEITGQTKNKNTYIIEIDFEQWWANIIHKKIAQVIDEKKQEIDKLCTQYNILH